MAVLKPMIDKQPPLASSTDVELLPPMLQRVKVEFVMESESFEPKFEKAHTAPPITSLLKSYDEHVTSAEESANLQFRKEVLKAWGIDAYTAPP